MRIEKPIHKRHAAGFILPSAAGLCFFDWRYPGGAGCLCQGTDTERAGNEQEAVRSPPRGKGAFWQEEDGFSEKQGKGAAQQEEGGQKGTR